MLNMGTVLKLLFITWTVKNSIRCFSVIDIGGHGAKGAQEHPRSQPNTKKRLIFENLEETRKLKGPKDSKKQSNRQKGANKGEKAKSAEEAAKKKKSPHGRDSSKENIVKSSPEEQNASEKTKDAGSEDSARSGDESTAMHAHPSESHFYTYSGRYALSPEEVKEGIAAASILGSHYDALTAKKGIVEGIKQIRSVLVYPLKNGLFTDYWGKIMFRYNESGVLVDETGLFQGHKVEKKEEILKSGHLTEIGLYQKNNLPKEEVDSNYVSMKLLLGEIANSTHKDIKTLHDEKVGLEFVEGITEYYNHMQRSQNSKSSCMTVCVCDDSTCSLPCKAIKCIEPVYLM